jgi:hypothetical protein
VPRLAEAGRTLHSHACRSTPGDARRLARARDRGPRARSASATSHYRAAARPARSDRGGPPAMRRRERRPTPVLERRGRARRSPRARGRLSELRVATAECAAASRPQAAIRTGASEGGLGRRRTARDHRLQRLRFGLAGRDAIASRARSMWPPAKPPSTRGERRRARAGVMHRACPPRRRRRADAPSKAVQARSDGSHERGLRPKWSGCAGLSEAERRFAERDGGGRTGGTRADRRRLHVARPASAGCAGAGRGPAA